MKITVVLFFTLQVADLLLVSSSLFSRSELRNKNLTEASQSKQQTVPMMKGKHRNERMLFARRVRDRQRPHAKKPKAVAEPRKWSPPKNPKAGPESTKLSRPKVKPKPTSPRCSVLGDSCVPHHARCCGPCVSCHCRFFNAICYCRKTNSQCSKKG